jgi:molecular chaperone GrpE
MSKDENQKEMIEEETPISETQEKEISLEESLKTENKELKDRLFRALADLENDRKRFEREKDESLKFAITGFARDLLSVSDNLIRALESVSKDALNENDTLKTLFEGVSMTEAELKKVFEKHKIEIIDPQGQPFSHHEHQAMFEVEKPDTQDGTIVQVLQKGYKLHDRLLRPAMVGVAKTAKPQS